jgi:hypothetical protein
MLSRAILPVLVMTVAWATPAVGADAASPVCEASVVAAEDFGDALVLSSPSAAAFMPALATLGDRVLIAWQETDSARNRVAYAIAREGCVGSVRYVEDPMANPRSPAVAATASGWVLAYEARETPRPLVRSIRLAEDGSVVSGPQTISAPGAVASRVRVAASGDDVVYAWTDVFGHHFARTGPVEQLAPTAVGVRLQAAGLVNFPRVAVDPQGTVYLAYRDGGPERTDFEIRLLIRPPGRPFSSPVNVSRSHGLMSDDVAIVVEPDGRLRLAWVEQDDERPEAFEVVHATVDHDLVISRPERFGTLGAASFKPALVGGPFAVWQVGTARSGRLYFADGLGTPVHIQTELTGGMASLAADSRGALHLAYVDTQDPPRLRYTARSRP